ncbi:hypothetical protein [Bacillus cereus]|uniref:Uncharacterized protein n=1 Tax=Bacillus cereus HuA4-10 TaxID=1053206 RepID=J8DGD4_BACCE|nr:hypothetical protein [Bacillus cereus]EJQ83836.1 hypothetical protein IGC_01362 [Bacillus cereus HuA4-10]
MEIYNEQIKKRIMFNKDSDYYFIAYNSLLILDHLNCYEGKSNFCDYRKLIYILPFIAEDTLLKIVTKEAALKEEEIKILEDIYIKARLREPILKSIFFTLEKKGYIKMEKNKTRKSIDVQLVPNSISSDFLNSEIFTIESKNIALFKSYYQRLTIISLESLIGKLFKERGVIIWDI